MTDELKSDYFRIEIGKYEESEHWKELLKSDYFRIEINPVQKQI